MRTHYGRGFKPARDGLLCFGVVMLLACTLRTHSNALSSLLPDLPHEVMTPWPADTRTMTSEQTSASEASEETTTTVKTTTPETTSEKTPETTSESRGLLAFPAATESASTIVPFALGTPQTTITDALGIPQTAIMDKNDITMATHASIHKLERIQMQIERWGGPVSLAMYVTDEDELQTLTDFVNSNEYTFRNTAIHLLIEKHDDDNNSTELGYPHNQLRNVALDNVQTDYFLAMDVDFVTSPTTYLELRLLITRDDPQVTTFLQEKGILVLPAFERFMPSELNPNDDNTEVTLDMIPNTKEDLIWMVKDRTVAPFHANFSKGHGPTDFIKWYKFTSSNTTYPITYKMKFEPYVLAYKPNIPRYFEKLRGYGMNKISWFVELHHRDYRFAVLRDQFVVHLNHPAGSGRKVPTATRNKFRAFHRDLKIKYGKKPV